MFEYSFEEQTNNKPVTSSATDEAAVEQESAAVKTEENASVQPEPSAADGNVANKTKMNNDVATGSSTLPATETGVESANQPVEATPNKPKPDAAAENTPTAPDTTNTDIADLVLSTLTPNNDVSTAIPPETLSTSDNAKKMEEESKTDDADKTKAGKNLLFSEAYRYLIQTQQKRMKVP